MACISAPLLVHPILLMGNVVQVGAYRSEAEGQPQKIIGRHRSNSCGDLICYAIRYVTGIEASPYEAATGQLS